MPVACSDDDEGSVDGGGTDATGGGGATDGPEGMDGPEDTGPQPDVAASAFCAIGKPVPAVSAGKPIPAVVPPNGFCVRHFASVKVARTLVVAPNGDLLVGAPSMATPGGASGGPGAILVLSDDDKDGVAEVHTFASGIGEVHGLAIGDGFLYFTTKPTVFRTPYTPGQRKETGPREDLGLAGTTFGVDGGRWTHGLARSVGGQLLASRGQYNTCDRNAGGEIGRVGMNQYTLVARGFRNPMYMRCHYQDEICAATELGEDQTPGAREKLVMIRPDTDYGYPCCFTAGKPVTSSAQARCAPVTREDAEFVLAETPFGFDWERGLWPEPYRGGLFVALHGSFYTSPPWGGARLVYAKTDPTTRAPIEKWKDFLGGFGPNGTVLERPSDIAFSPDGRMFFSDDQGGEIYWLAPLSLPRP